MGGNLLRALRRTDAECGFHASAFGIPDGASTAHRAGLERVADTPCYPTAACPLGMRRVPW